MRSAFIGLSILAILTLPLWAEAQARWTWCVLEACVGEADPDFFTLTLGLKADSSIHTGRLGHCNVRGVVSGDLADFGGLADPVLILIPQGYTATVTDGPHNSDWQLNMVLETGDGLPVDTLATPVVTMAFTILNPEGRSGLEFTSLQQTFLADYRTAVSVTYDTTGGDAGLLPSVVDGGRSGSIPGRFALMPNFPNPFNAATTLTYAIPAESHVRCDILTSSGQFVISLVDARQGPGTYSVVWNGANGRGDALPSGIYMITLRAGPHFAAHKAIILR